MSQPTPGAQFSMEWVGALPLFRDLLPRELETVYALLEWREMPAETTLVRPGAAGETLYFVVSGVLKATAPGEREIIMGLRGPGTLAGDLSLLDGGDVLQIMTQTPCELVTLSRYDFWNSVWPMPAVPFNMTQLLAERIRAQNAQVLALSTLDVPSRLARQLAMLTREFGQPGEGRSVELPFPLTQLELAKMVGTSRIHVNQTLARWKEGQLVTFTRGKMVVSQPQVLYRMAAQSQIEAAQTPDLA